MKRRLIFSEIIRSTDMKVKLSFTKFRERVQYVPFMHFHLYGLPYLNPTGLIPPSYKEEILDIVAQHPNMHIASIDEDFNGINFYVPDSPYYYLCTGDADPNLEMSTEETSKAIAAMTEADHKAYADAIRACFEEDFDPRLWETIVNRCFSTN